MSEPRPAISYCTSISDPSEEQSLRRARNLDAPRLRDIRKRLDAPAPQISQTDIDALATELMDDIVALASDYIGNVVVQKLFERCSSALRVRSVCRSGRHAMVADCAG